MASAFMILSSLGVKDEIFEEIQKKIIKKYCDLLSDPLKALSSDNSLFYEFKNRLNRFIPIFELFYKKNINLLDEPLISQFINIFVYSKLITIKYTGKINDKRCVCLMGVIDETNTLEEDEVYINLVYSTEYSEVNKILNQNVTVYRSPSLYPGDIKILKAVENPFLSHMKNVIVFSKKGKRPTFNKLSGGDLDGDRYFVLFNDYITSNIKEKNYPPLEDHKYLNNNNNKYIKNSKITIEDSINCIIEASKKDLVGVICDNHMAFADKSPLKAKDDKCVQLCKYFNQEVDANKTGNFIEISTLKENHLIIKGRPDFLSNGVFNENKVYKSPGILGKLYRMIDKKEIYDIFRINFFNKVIRRNYEINLKYITKDCFQYLSNAYIIYNNYKIMLCNLMKKYNFCTESELFLNLRVFKNNRGNRGKSDSYTIELNRIIENINDEIHNIFKYIDKNVASAIYIASYINIKSVNEKKVDFSDDFDENIAKLLNLFESEKNDFQNLFKNYSDYASLKRNRKGDIKNKYKRIFSLPWIIKDIRDLLISL